MNEHSGTVRATFSTRREADLAIEHLVQEHGVDRNAISVMAASDAGSSGRVIGGSDAASAPPTGHGDRADAPTNGAIELRIENAGDRSMIEQVLNEVGAQIVEPT